MVDKEQASGYLENLGNQIRGLGIKQRILEFSSSCEADPQKLAVWNESKVFLGYCEESFHTDIVVRLHNLFDVKSGRSLIHYLKQTEKYLPGILGPTIHDPQIALLRKEINTQLTRAEAFRPILKSLEVVRHKYCAHFGEYFGNPEALLRDAPLPTEGVVKLIDFCKVVVNWHEVNVFHSWESDWLEDDGRNELELLLFPVPRNHDGRRSLKETSTQRLISN